MAVDQPVGGGASGSMEQCSSMNSVPPVGVKPVKAAAQVALVVAGGLHHGQVDVSAVHEEGFYMPVQRVCRPNHEFRGFQGQIESGSIAVGDTITSQPSGEQAEVKNDPRG